MHFWSGFIIILLLLLWRTGDVFWGLRKSTSFFSKLPADLPLWRPFILSAGIITTCLNQVRGSPGHGKDTHSRHFLLITQTCLQKNNQSRLHYFRQLGTIENIILDCACLRELWLHVSSLLPWQGWMELMDTCASVRTFVWDSCHCVGKDQLYKGFHTFPDYSCFFFIADGKISDIFRSRGYVLAACLPAGSSNATNSRHIHVTILMSSTLASCWWADVPCYLLCLVILHKKSER